MVFLHYTGHLLRGSDDPRWRKPRDHLERLVSAFLAEQGVTRVYGSLACGADLLVVEQALKRGIEVVSYVPYGIEQFEILSVRIGGADEIARYRSVLRQLGEVRVLPREQSDSAPFRLTSDRAMSIAREDAMRCGARLLQLAVWDECPGAQGAAGDVAAWAAAGGKTLSLKLPEGVLHGTRSIPDRLNDTRIASYRLGEEVDRAWRAAGLGLAEAAVFHAARLLEGIFRTASRRLDLGIKTQETHSCIEALAGARVLDEPTRIAAHALRRAGNDVRHVQRSLGGEEHWVVLAFARLIVEWYGSRFSGGMRLADTDLKLPPTRYDLLIRRLLRCSTREQMNDILPELRSSLKLAPILASVTIEKAIDFQLWDEAEKLILRAGQLESRNRRTLELKALLYSRKGQPERAIDLLGTLKIRPFDDELSGILAGAHKRIWMQRGNALHLHKATNLYMHAWNSSGLPYVGINAAACQSWCGNTTEARSIATRVIRVLGQQASHWPEDGDKLQNWDFYSLATMAEALLLCGNLKEAHQWEKHALARGHDSGAPVKVFTAQMALHRQQ